MEATARNVDAAGSAVLFEDGLGLRYLVADPSGAPSGEALEFRPALASARSFEFALRERVARLVSFSHPAFSRLRGAERTGGAAPGLRLLSEPVDGARLSQMLARAQALGVSLDTSAALCLTRQLVAAIAALHERARDLSHGAIAPERLLVTPAGRLFVVEHAMGAALQQLRYPGSRYWSELRVAVPPSAGPVLLDQRVDVAQIGAVALALVLGRDLSDLEVPHLLADLINSAPARSTRGDIEPLPSGLRGWLGRALQLDPLRSFSSAIDARVELDLVLGDTDDLASVASLEAFIERLEDAEPIPGVSRPAPSPESLTSTRREVSLDAIDAALDGAKAGLRVVAAASDAPTTATEPVPAAVVDIESAPASSIAVPADAAAITREEPLAEPSPVPTASLSLAAIGESGDSPDHVADSESVVAPAVESAAVSDVAVVRSADAVTASPAANDQVAAPIELGHLLRFERWPDAARPVDATPARDEASMPAAAAPDMFRIDAAMDAAVVDSPDPDPDPDPNPAPAEQAVRAPASAARSSWRRAATAGIVPAILAAVAGYTVASAAPFAPLGVLAPGAVELATGPAGVDTFVDGTFRGVTPLRIELTPGLHTIALHRPSADPFTVPVTIFAGMKVSQFVDMPVTVDPDADSTAAAAFSAGRLADTGEVTIVSDALLHVFEGDDDLGTSLDALELPIGPHELTLVDEAAGIRTIRVVDVDTHKPVVVKVAVPTGLLAVNATPKAEVWVDGNRRGATPLPSLTLRAGAHDVVFRHPDLGDHRRAVVVTAGDVLRLNVDLREH